MASTFPTTTVTSGTTAQTLMANRMAAAGAAEPTGGLSQQDYMAWAVAELLVNGPAGTAVSVTNGITAFATGGQANAVALTTPINTVSTCATAGDSVKLPTAAPGAVVFVKNNGAAALDVFPATGDLINALTANTAVRLAAPSATIFFCTVAGTWHAQLPAYLPAKFTTRALSSSTANAGDLTGAAHVVLVNTGATPGTLTTRTAAQMFADTPNATPGDTYTLTVVNAQGTGTLTVGGAAAGVTYTGTMTIAINTSRRFTVTLTSASAVTIQNVDAATFS